MINRLQNQEKIGDDGDMVMVAEINGEVLNMSQAVSPNA